MRTPGPLRRVSIARVAVLAGCLALAACGGGEESSAAAGSAGAAGTGGTDTGGTGGNTGGTGGTDTGGTGGTDTGGTAGTGGTTPAVEGDNADDCHDNVDNDQNGLTDCADPNCDGVTCRPGNGACDAPELCENFECPADELEPDTTVCRASAGACDLPESCTGTSPDCPANTFVAAATVCRPSAGVCDVEEVCTGSSPTCPLNTFSPATTVCRAAVGVCDASEFCTGSSSACPSDEMQPITHVCRSAHPEGCDVQETCDGLTNTCPADVMLSPLSGFTSVVARSDFSCGLSSTSGVVCWGLNDNGQLGDGTHTTRDIPTSVTGLGSGVIAVTVGARHACALTSAGAVKCWGDNATGQLGNGTMVSSAIPVSVSGLSSGVTAIAAGGAHTCARLSSGSVQCWGNNMYGSLGDGTTTNRTAPTNVTGLSSGVVAITAGADHTCALTTTGGIKCWGDAYLGQVGDGTWVQKNTPVNVSGLTSGVAAVAAGMIHTCAITIVGGLKCWGGGTDGQLGDGSSFHRSTPVSVVGLASGVTAVAADASSTCAITATGNVKCWGSAAMDMGGNVGDWTVPFDVAGVPTDVTGVAVGRAHACVLTNAGGIFCWGDNDYGQVGNGMPSDWTLPTSFSALSSDTAGVAIQGQHGCALSSSGGVKCWGSNGYGQLGNGTTSSSAAPVDATGLSAGVTSLATGQSDSYAVTSEGALKCWGYCYGNSSSTPTDVAGLTSGVAAVTQGFGHTCVLTTLGGAKCWGWNMDGQVGNGSSQDAVAPTDVVGLTTGVTAIAAGGKHTCALMSTGGVKCWGDNEWGQLGAGSGFDGWEPQDVLDLDSGVVAIAAGRSHACALTTEGAVKCWGANDQGQLGTVQGGVGPLDVFGLNAGIATIAAGRWHTCAVTAAGGVKCWGGNETGQLGDGSTSNSLIPMDVPGLSSGFGSVAAGENHTCAVSTAGTVSCWGLNDFGLVTGLASWSPAPVCGAPGGT